MRTLAIDLGARRVGLALSDEGGKFATPLETLKVSSAEQALEPIQKIVRREGVRRVVIGLPLNMDGSIGPAAKGVMEWGKKLGASGFEIVYVDERLSSFDAEQRLVERKRSGEKLTRKRKKEQLDAMAATIFLQEFLDGKLSAMPLE